MEEKKLATIRIDEEVKKELDTFCKKNRLKIGSQVEFILKEFLEKEKKKEEKKQKRIN